MDSRRPSTSDSEGPLPTRRSALRPTGWAGPNGGWMAWPQRRPGRGQGERLSTGRLDAGRPVERRPQAITRVTSLDDEKAPLVGDRGAFTCVSEGRHGTYAHGSLRLSLSAPDQGPQGGCRL